MDELKPIADLLGDCVPPKLKELHCHPDVANWLMLTSAEAKPQFPGQVGGLTSIPVFEEPEFEDGVWELREDGLAVTSGHVDVPFFARRVKIEFHFHQPADFLSRYFLSRYYMSPVVNDPAALIRLSGI